MAVPTIINLSDSTPAPPDGFANVKWQADALNPRNTSAYLPSQGGVSAQSGAYSVVATDRGKLLKFNSASDFTITLPDASTIPTTFLVYILNVGAGVPTLSPASGQINGASSVSIASGAMAVAFSDGTNWWVGGFSEGVNATEIQGIPVSSTVPTNGYALVYNSATSKWEPQAAGGITPVNVISNWAATGSNSGWANFTLQCSVSGIALLFTASSWKVNLHIASGTATIATLHVHRCLLDSTTIIDTTDIQYGGSTAPFNLSAGHNISDAVSLALDASHDYYIQAYFDSSSNNSTVAVSAGTGGSMTYWDPSGDQTASVYSGGTHAPLLIQQILWNS